ncbi:lysozyme [Planotetraspora silvatica]|uniref:Lysozyme n=1 Tax=Planotetraspora silvatica TaxID=234614 RepID=A0A8J3UZE3_9ACTN|nr:GH25 family lysozyme [Planotetraspora silvatica]GII51224.1 lysozyme [Planotetraspora silvatica]
MPTHRFSTTVSPVHHRLDRAGKRLRSVIGGVALAASVISTTVAPANRTHAIPLTYGQDVSGYESNHDWSASPAKFGIVKATEGLTYRDPSFARQWQELGKKGMVRGAYDYGHPGNDPIAEAEHFLSVVNDQPAKKGDLLVLDLETTDGQSVDHVNTWAKRWLAYVKAETGATPLFYSGWDFADTYGHGLAGYPLWVAYYGRAKGDVTPPADWKTWTIHQYTDTPIDQNVSALSSHQLRLLGRR